MSTTIRTPSRKTTRTSVSNAGCAQVGAAVLAPPAHALPDVAGGAARFVETALEWLDRWRQRQHLMALDDRLLSDIGLSRSAAEKEFRKPFWRA